jgi:hypothetical protein
VYLQVYRGPGHSGPGLCVMWTNFALKEFYEVRARPCNPAPSRTDRARTAGEVSLPAFQPVGACTKRRTAPGGAGECLGHRAGREGARYFPDPKTRAGARA